MKILITGYDGYIGYPLTLHLLKQGHSVLGIDNLSRRKRVNEVGSDSLTPILPAVARQAYLTLEYGARFQHIDLTIGVDHYGHLRASLAFFKPDAIVHLAEQPSAPWSMASAYHANETQRDNVLGTLDLLWAIREECPDTHLVKLGTMGEYGTPNCIIPEGRIPEDCLGNETHRMSHKYFSCPMRDLLFPRTPGSFYHLSKVHDTHNIEFSCRTWGLRSTDIMQGIVFGLTPLQGHTGETRFDYDEYFGTVINRFCVQALIGQPLTVYGKGEQTRGFLPLKESIQCLTLALENSPGVGEYRTFNQFGTVMSINTVANKVNEVADSIGLSSYTSNIENPRIEDEEHYYDPTRQELLGLGYKPTSDIKPEIQNVFRHISLYKDRINKEVILPKTKWN